MALQCKRLKYLEKRMYFLLTSQDKCLEFMTLEYESFKVKVTNNKYTECPKKHGNSVTNWISSLL